MTHGGVGSRRAQLGAACALAWMPGPSPTCRWCRRIRRRASRRPLCTTLYSVSACLGGGTCDQRRACSAELAARGSAQEGAMPPPEHKPGSKTPVGKPRPTAKETGVANCRVVQRELHAPRSSEQIKPTLGGCSRTRDTRSSRSAGSQAGSLAPGTVDRSGVRAPVHSHRCPVHSHQPSSCHPGRNIGRRPNSRRTTGWLRHFPSVRCCSRAAVRRPKTQAPRTTG